ncbi:hypothetical protein LMG26846_03638 [Achromobacter insuavis]|uniref:Bug family tripartite tricarboxylate transporter substrate binding protein n=1 Tax=Achromobacter insuavis TaxID=1287735 RepID=UPI001464F4F3|nr:tripartite tricarboxylate transporter substrate binding protein [Achromobacter insuavis]CAB3883723.1 hypothetical protein LMG26846_03638 [Achromobacter insuavis]
MIRHLCKWILGATLSLASIAAQAAYPDKPITLLTPFPAGGTSDILARMVAEHLGKAWGQPVIVQNKPGASGLIAMSQVIKAAPDGYTLTITSSGTASINPHLFQNPPYDTFKDFTHVTILVDLPFLLVVEQSSSVKTLADYIARAKAKPDGVTLGISGIGSHQFLAAHQMTTQAGIQVNLIPYKGSSQQIVDLLGGSLDSMLDNVATQIPMIQTGKVRPLAISTTARIAQLPQVPTFDEAGLAGFQSIPWFGLAAPAGTSPEITEKIQAEIAAYFKQPDTRRKLDEMGVVPAAITPQETLARLRAEYRALGQAVDTLGLPKQ